MQKIELRIDGLDCAEEVRTLEAELGPLAGVEKLDFDLLQARLIVSYSADTIEPEQLMAAVRRTGMRAEPFRETPATLDGGTAWQHYGRAALTALSGLLIVAGFAIESFDVGWRAALEGNSAAVSQPARWLFVAAMLAGAWFVAPKAWGALRRARPDMNLLMVAAIGGALVLGQYLEAATVAFLFALSLSLESWSVGRARRAIGALLALSPAQARVLADCGHEHATPVERVPVGSRVLVKPGDVVPLDGRIVQGQTSVNQAPLTGESLPVAKTLDDEVFAGSINFDGTIEIVTLKPAAESLASEIVKLVREAQSKRSASEQWVQSFARRYTPAVMLLALTVALVGWLASGNWSLWCYQALVLLVIACPCALVISTPVSIVAALASAARHGVLIKGGLYVELPARLQAIALDKTGTLTAGRPVVCELAPLAGHDEAELLAIASAIEQRSEHPLAQAIVHFAAARGIRPQPVSDYQAVPGRGATALLDGQSVWIGSHAYLEERGKETPEMHEQLEALAATGRSLVIVGEERHVCGFIALEDRLRPTAAQAVRELSALGIRHVVMLTGDNWATASAIAAAGGIEHVEAELSPQGKVEAVESLLQRFETVAMVGEGYNDAPALARASLGIAIGAAGTTAAIETADIALMSDDLLRLPWLVRHSRRTLAIIRQNIAASLAVKLLFVLLTLAGHASLWSAIAADTGVSLVVVLNALRLLDGRTGGGKREGIANRK